MEFETWTTAPAWQAFIPDAGLFLTIGLGVLFGLAIGAAISEIVRGRLSAQSLWAGALALLAVSVGYSLPVYHRELSALLWSSGLSSFKISVADITLEAALAAKGHQGAVSGSGKDSGSQPQSVVRPTDPTPGVRALYADFVGNEGRDNTRTYDNSSSGDNAPKLNASIIDRDLEYIKYTRQEPLELSQAVATSTDIRIYLRPISLLAKCLNEYKNSIQEFPIAVDRLIVHHETALFDAQ